MDESIGDADFVEFHELQGANQPCQHTNSTERKCKKIAELQRRSSNTSDSGYGVDHAQILFQPTPTFGGHLIRICLTGHDPDPFWQKTTLTQKQTLSFSFETSKKLRVDKSMTYHFRCLFTGFHQMISPVFNGFFTYFPSPFQLKSWVFCCLTCHGEGKNGSTGKKLFQHLNKNSSDCPAKAGLFSSLCDDWISQPAL